MHIRFLFLTALLLLSLCGATQKSQLKEQVIISARHYFKQGLIAAPYFITEMEQQLPVDTTPWKQSLYAKSAMLIAQNLLAGYSVKPWFSYDAVSGLVHQKKVNSLRGAILEVRTSQQLTRLYEQLIRPKTAAESSLFIEYLHRNQLAVRLGGKDNKDTLSYIRQAYFIYKWIGNLGLDHYLVVDLSKAELRYVANQRDSINMKAVVGKPDTPTPFFATWLSQLVLYPYWYVPLSIATQEFLPKIKRNPAWLNAQNMQVIDKGGHILDPDTIHWKRLSASYFPYTLRQSTGCDNALGVLKVEFSTPFGVYIHDTNNKAAFLRQHRFLSHGCIRVEEPFQLGELVMKEKLDTSYLQSCLLEQKPIYRKIVDSIPVFSIYTIARPLQGGGVEYIKDVYSLFN